ncbi:pyruvate dehydrogenase complex E1 component subunit beta, partial [Mesorhizobium sp. M7A.F.Ca.AU.001.01.1.1]
LKNEGDKVVAGDVIAEIETDKATMEVEAVDEGTLGKILIAAGTEGVKVNTPIAVLLQDGESAGDIGKSSAPAKAESPAKAEAPAAAEDKAEAAKPAAAPVAAAPKTEIAADPDIPAGTEMVSTTVREALRDAMAEEMRRDGDVFVMGE